MDVGLQGARVSIAVADLRSSADGEPSSAARRIAATVFHRSSHSSASPLHAPTYARVTSSVGSVLPDAAVDRTEYEYRARCDSCRYVSLSFRRSARKPSANSLSGPSGTGCSDLPTRPACTTSEPDLRPGTVPELDRAHRSNLEGRNNKGSKNNNQHATDGCPHLRHGRGHLSGSARDTDGRRGR